MRGKLVTVSKVRIVWHVAWQQARIQNSDGKCSWRKFNFGCQFFLEGIWYPRCLARIVSASHPFYHCRKIEVANHVRIYCCLWEIFLFFLSQKHNRKRVEVSPMWGENFLLAFVTWTHIHKIGNPQRWFSFFGDHCKDSGLPSLFCTLDSGYWNQIIELNFSNMTCFIDFLRSS